MTVEAPSLFSQVIQEHLDLKRQNAELESNMPLDRYKAADPFNNHPLFKTEEQARLEETMDGQESLPESPELGWPGEEALVAEQQPVEVDAGLWSRSRDFDWGD
jgi:hypothetical protein